MNILHSYTDLKPGGACKMMINMANIMVNNGHKVSIISSNGELKSSFDKKLNYVFFNIKIEKNLISRLLKYIYAFYFYLNLIKKKDIKIVINHHRYLSPIFFIIKLFVSLKVIYVAHATLSPLWFFKSKIFGDKIWAISQTVKNHFIKNFNIIPNNIEVILNSVPELKIIGEDKINRIKNELNISNNKIILCVAHYRKLKRQDFLIDAFKISLNTNKNSILILYGYGNMEAFLKNKVNKENLCEKVFFINDKYSVEDIVNISDIIVLPSSREGLSIALIEGLSLGKPLIGTENTGMQEVINHGHNGFLFKSDSIDNLAKYINLILSNDDLYNNLSTNARTTYLNKFNFNNYEKKLLNMLSKFEK